MCYFVDCERNDKSLRLDKLSGAQFCTAIQVIVMRFKLKTSRGILNKFVTKAIYHSTYNNNNNVMD